MARRDFTGPVIAQRVNRGGSERALSSTDMFESKSRTFFWQLQKALCDKE